MADAWFSPLDGPATYSPFTKFSYSGVRYVFIHPPKKKLKNALHPLLQL